MQLSCSPTVPVHCMPGGIVILVIEDITNWQQRWDDRCSNRTGRDLQHWPGVYHDMPGAGGIVLAGNMVPEVQQVPVFLTLVGEWTYVLLRDLSPKPADQNLKLLVDTLRQHYKPKKVVMVKRFKFHQCKQEPGETVAVFEAELRKLAARYEFGEGLEEALRDRLVCGLREQVHRKCL